MTTTDHRVDPTTLAGWLADGTDLRLLDVRSPAEFETAHIPGSYNVPLGDLGDHADELRRHLDVPVVLVCQSGGRAGQANGALAEAGMANLHVLAGGLQAWDDGQRDLRCGKARWDLEHQVRFAAGSLVLAGIVASIKAPRARYLAGAVGGGLAFAAVVRDLTAPSAQA